MIDLHCHSHFSDGLLSPSALISKAKIVGIQMLALTDHDTVLGLNELHEAAINSAIQLINGIELSARWKKHDIHIIGLKIDPNHPLLKACIQAQDTCRITRAQLIGDCLLNHGIHDAYLKACQLAGHNRVGRPHYAQVLVQEALVKDIQQAFKRYLGRGKSAYVPTEWPEVETIVDTILRVGGVPVLAHPHKYKLTQTKLNALISTFKEAGGIGLEVVSGFMTPSEMIQMASLCNRFDLLASSGSDFHGDQLSRVGLGQQIPLPEMCTPVWKDWIVH